MSVTAEEVPEAGEVPMEPFHVVCDDNGNSVQWIGVCYNNDESIAKWMRDNDVLDLHLLVVVAQGNVEVARKLVPFDKGMAHFAFPRAGTFEVFATLVYEEKNNASRARRLFNHRDYEGGYTCQLIDEFDGGLREDFRSRSGKKKGYYRAKRHSYVATHTITVSAGNFAKERAKWRTKLVGWYFANNGKNECNWRKRWLGSLALTVTWLPFQYLAKLVGMFLFTLGGFVYDHDFKLFPKPGRHGSIIEMFGYIDKHSAWWFKRDGSQQFKERNPFWIGMTILVSFWLILSTAIFVFDDVTFTNAMQVGVLSLLGLALLVGVCFGIFFLKEVIDDRHSSPERKKKRKKKREKKREKEREAKEKDIGNQLSSLSCTASGQPMTVNRLIERRKTAPSVVWHQTKDKVCKPFQQH